MRHRHRGEKRVGNESGGNQGKYTKGIKSLSIRKGYSERKEG